MQNNPNDIFKQIQGEVFPELNKEPEITITQANEVTYLYLSMHIIF